MKKSPQIIASYVSSSIRVCHETRPVGVLGPQKVAHPDALELSVVEHGCDHAIIGGHPITTNAGQYGLVGPGVEHSSWTDRRPSIECNIHLPLTMLEPLADELGINLRRLEWPAEPFASPPELTGIMAALKQELTSSDAGQQLVMNSLASYLGAMVLRRHFSGGRRLPDAHIPGLAARLRSVEELLRASPEQPHSVEELAAVAKVSRFHFLRAFKQQYGSPPYGYLLKIRLERGAEQLQTTELSITTIAHELGFGSSGRFSDTFKRAYGVTPSAWRRQNRRLQR